MRDVSHDGAVPVFDAPWEAQAFAMTLALHARGVFTWKEWAQALALGIDEAKQRGEADTGEEYYRHWLIALERIAADKGLVTDASLQQRRDEWEAAAHRTPHGQAIELRSAGISVTLSRDLME
ncbi:MAG: nitrile hydratase accessory protein [Betaproteobacteria bacterium]